jgi:hypothetical protein
LAFNGMNFLFFAIGVSMIIGALRSGRGRRYRDLPPMAQQPTLLEDPRVPRLQAEIDELRGEVERLAAAESFYAQLNAPKPDVPSPTG